MVMHRWMGLEVIRGRESIPVDSVPMEGAFAVLTPDPVLSDQETDFR